jgi:hypothetical protein
MPDTSVEEARSPTDAWTDEVVGLAKEAVLTFFEHGPSSEQHLDAMQQLWTAVEVFGLVHQTLQGGGEDASTAAQSGLLSSREWLPPPRGAANCARCGRALTLEAQAQGQAECSAHAPGKVEIRRPDTRS